MYCNVCTHVSIYVCMYACMHAWMDVCMHACMHACMYVWLCMYVCGSRLEPFGVGFSRGLKTKREASVLSAKICHCCEIKRPLCQTNTDCRPGCGGLPASSRLSRELRTLQSSEGFSPKEWICVAAATVVKHGKASWQSKLTELKRAQCC